MWRAVAVIWRSGRSTRPAISHPSKTDTAAMTPNATANHTSRECKSAECCALNAACTEPPPTGRLWTVFECPGEEMIGPREGLRWTLALNGKRATNR